MAKSRRPDIDWQAIENDYRAGVLSIRTLAKLHSVSHQAIAKHAKRHGWKRDLGAKVRERTRQVLARREAAAAHREVAGCHAHTTGNPDDEAIVDAAARSQIEVVRGHRQAIATAYRICEALFRELMVGTEGAFTVDDLIAIVTANDANSTQRRALEKLTGLGARSGAMRQLTASLRDLVTLERTAFSLDVDDSGKPPDLIPIEDRLKAYAREKAIAAAGDKVAVLGPPLQPTSTAS